MDKPTKAERKAFHKAVRATDKARKVYHAVCKMDAHQDVINQAYWTYQEAIRLEEKAL